MRLLRSCAIALAIVPAALQLMPRAEAEQPRDLDVLMREVLTRRDENWRKLQQYVLEEREAIELRGPSQRPIWGEHREYTWYIRNGLFVRSPVKANGAAVPEADRRKYEDEYLKRQQARERRGGQSAVSPSGGGIDPGDPNEAADADSVLKQTRQPQFISMSYFLRFKFEEGKYALVGRETLDGRETLRIEYYPERLFTGTDRRRNRRTSDEDRAYDQEFRRLMNKVALVTLWVEPNAKQIVKYTFNNVALDFLPVQWLMRVDEVTASMNMGQPFPDVWLPRDLQIDAAMSIVSGQYYVHYGVEYHDYRQADVTSKIKIP
jgi:hypothetical protein